MGFIFYSVLILGAPAHQNVMFNCNQRALIPMSFRFPDGRS